MVVSDPERTASTLLRVLAGLSRADHGTIRIAGSSDPTSEGWGRRVAYLGSDPGLPTWMTPFEALWLAGELLDLPPHEISRRVERTMAWARISADAASRPMSRGGISMQQRAGLAAALMGDPEVILLDEPLRALDARERSGLLRIPGRRRTIMIASRYPASEAGLVAHVVYLRRGRVDLIAPVSALEHAGLPLSHSGIAALARMRAALRARGAAPA